MGAEPQPKEGQTIYRYAMNGDPNTVKPDSVGGFISIDELRREIARVREMIEQRTPPVDTVTFVAQDEGVYEGWKAQGSSELYPRAFTLRYLLRRHGQSCVIIGPGFRAAASFFGDDNTILWS